MRTTISLQEASQLICQEIIRPGVSYQYVIVRNDKGDMKLYLNGYLCASGRAAFADFRTPSLLGGFIVNFICCLQDLPLIMASSPLTPRGFGFFTRTIRVKTPLET